MRKLFFTSPLSPAKKRMNEAVYTASLIRVKKTIGIGIIQKRKLRLNSPYKPYKRIAHEHRRKSKGHADFQEILCFYGLAVLS